jgi:stress-induced morphogen
LQENKQTADHILEVLKQRLAPASLELVDESHLHASHGPVKKGGHYVVRIVSDQFEGKMLVERHQMIYAILREELREDKIHALSLKTLTPAEAEKQ